MKIRTFATTLLATVVLTTMGGMASAQARPVDTGGDVISYGHSWPAGYGVPEGYPQMVAEALQRPYVDRAVGGDLVAGTSARAQLQPPHAGDVVILETGLNDARAYGMAGVDAFRDFFTGTLYAMRDAQRVVIVLDQSIPRWHAYAPYSHGSTSVIRAYNRVIRDVARSYPNVQVVRARLHPAGFQPDGVHPNRRGHLRLAHRVERALL